MQVAGFDAELGTSGDDTFFLLPFDELAEAYFGLDGDDSFAGTFSRDPIVFVGGAGDDSYDGPFGTPPVVLNQGGGNDVLVIGVSFQVTIRTFRDHLVFDAGGTTGYVALVYDWQRSDLRIDTYDAFLLGGSSRLTLSHEELAQELDRLGVTEMIPEEFAARGIDIDALLDRVAELDRELSRGLLQGLDPAEARQVAYLYEAGLNRDGSIDLPGLNFWIDRREDGLSERQLSRVILESAEFEAAFGDAFDQSSPDYLDNRALVEQLYRNVLNREGEAAGTEFWTGRVSDPGFTRADLLLAFAGSPENVAGSPQVQTLSEIAPGEWDFIA